jgi:hypothetical protein
MASSVETRSHADGELSGACDPDALEQHRREYCHLIRDVAEDLRMYDLSCVASLSLVFPFQQVLPCTILMDTDVAVLHG